jgi:predicted phage terminase large subunit-like protein
MLPPALLKQIYEDRSVRTAITTKNHMMFFNIYFSEYVKSPTARFQKEFFAITEDVSTKLAVIVAFRGSGKSTILTLSYPLWAILGEQKKKFVLILSQTQRQARQHLLNIKRELERNNLLKADLGPFKEETDEWGSMSLVVPNYDAKIMAASTEQSVRGLRHGANRPDLILCDDIEDLESVKTKEGRDKTHQWLTGDVIPSGDQTTRVIIVGNLLHEDSVLMRIKQGIEEKKLDGIFRQCPLIDSNGVSAWPGKYPDEASLKTLERTIGNESSWHREFLLHIISDVERVVHPEWIKYYDVLPNNRNRLYYVATGIDLAISQKETADFTAMVSGWVCHGEDNRNMIYILPNPVNARLTFPEALEKAKWVCKTVDPGHTGRLFVEEVAYQKAFTQQLEHDGYHVEGIKVGNQDKRSRIALTTHMIKNGQILFPIKGCEDLVRQLTHFGVEKHDDLADAFTTLVLKVVDDNLGCMPFFFVVG